MAYCRWSCMNGYCDAYVYEDAHGGWTTHLAGVRWPEGAPESGMDAMFYAMNAECSNDEVAQAYKDAQQARDDWNKQNPPQPIEHPEAGASFNHDTPGECAENLERLRKEGFRVPDWAIDELREEERFMKAVKEAV
jgi:hypothetical protein